MSIDYELLRVLHHKLRLRTEYESQINRAPIKIRLVRETETKLEQEFTGAKDNLTRARMNADERQLQLSGREAKVEDLKNRRNAAESNKEYQLLNEQIAADEQANSVLSDEIFELLEKIDELESVSKSAQENLEKAKSETRNSVEKIEKDLVISKSQLAEVNEAIAKLESQLPIDVKAEYQRLVKSRADEALSESNEETCGNCNQRLTAQIKTDLNVRKAVFCNGCGSLMYIASRTAAGS